MVMPCCMIFVHVDCAVIQWDSPVKTWICGKCGSQHTAAHLKGEWHKAANDMRVNLVRQGLIDKMRYPPFYKHRDHKYNWNDRNTWPYCWVHDFQGYRAGQPVMVGTGTQFEDWYREYFANSDGRQPFFINEPYPGYVVPNALKNKSARVVAQESSSKNYQQQAQASSSTYYQQQAQASSSTHLQLPPPAAPRTRRLRQAPPRMGITLRISQHMSLSIRPSFFLPSFSFYISLTDPFQLLFTSFRSDSHIQYFILPF